ncbi:response regulator [bacterium]|nr:response regulator [bacterium]
MKILVVDDSGVSRKMLIKSIPENIREKCEIFQAENGLEAVEKYKSDSPDIVFLDLTMPIMDGYEALKEIIEYDPSAIVFVISADIQQKAKERVLELGASGMESKPIKPEKMTSIFYYLMDVIDKKLD